MSNVTQEKNLIYVGVQGTDKKYVFDINTGVVMGLNNKPLKSLSNGKIRSAIKEIHAKVASTKQSSIAEKMIACIAEYRSQSLPLEEIGKYSRIVNKLLNLGYLTNCYCYYCAFDTATNKLYAFVEAHWQAFLTFLKDYRERDDREVFYFETAFLANFKNNFLKRMAYKYLFGREMSDTEGMDENLIWYQKEIADAFASLQEGVFNTDERKAYFKHVINTHAFKQVYYFMQHRPSCFATFTAKNVMFYAHDIGMFFEHFFFLCEILKKPYSMYKDNFFRGYQELQIEMDVHTKTVDMDYLINFYQSRKKQALTFSNEDFIAIVPLTKKEFAQEGNNQHNCVYRVYTERVAKGITHIVFIRRKEAPEDSYITCEVNRDGYIIQFLFAHNKQIGIKDVAENKFKYEYQTHLNQNWTAK